MKRTRQRKQEPRTYDYFNSRFSVKFDEKTTQSIKFLFKANCNFTHSYELPDLVLTLVSTRKSTVVVIPKLLTS